MQMVTTQLTTRFRYRYVATHPSCMGWWFILDVCQDAKYHETSSIKALVHHIVCSCSEASNIAFLDLELLIGMQEFATISCDQDFWSYLESEVGGRSFLDLISCTVFEFFVSFAFITCHHMKRPVPRLMNQTTYLQKLVDGLALLINVCLCSDGWSPQTGITRRQNALSWHYYHNCC